MEGKLNIKVKHMNDKPHELTVEKANTILQIKEKLTPIINIPAKEQKLIFKGKILKDEDKASEVLEEGCSLHAVSHIVTF
jgi:UV excision repair protein RAD23